MYVNAACAILCNNYGKSLILPILDLTLSIEAIQQDAHSPLQSVSVQNHETTVDVRCQRLVIQPPWAARPPFSHNPLLRPPQPCWSVVISGLVSSPLIILAWVDKQRYCNSIVSCLSLKPTTEEPAFYSLLPRSPESARTKPEPLTSADRDSDVKSDCLLSTHAWS